MEFPKVLIFSQPFEKSTGGGITLSNLFKNWSKEKLAVACSGYLLSYNIDTDVCDNYYQLGYRETKWQFPFSIVQRKYASGPIKFSEKKKIQNVSLPKSEFRVKLIMKVLIPILDFLGLSHTIIRTKVSGEFINWVKNFNPDVIYVQPTTRDQILFCLSLHKSMPKPLILHVMDDWPKLISEKGLFKSYWSKKIDREFKDLLERSNVLMGISDAMSEEYKMRYGKDFLSFQNPINIGVWQKHQKTDYHLAGTPTILYAGRIGLGIDTSLEIVARAIQEINSERGLSLEFILCTERKPLWAGSYPSVKFKGFIPYELMPKTLSEADFLLLPYDFTPESIKYIKYSMPTKGPEYMMSGTPMIVFAPEETAIVKYCKQHDCAKVITENNSTEVANRIQELVNDLDERKRIGENAKQTAALKHDSLKITRDFEMAIKSAATQNLCDV